MKLYFIKKFLWKLLKFSTDDRITNRVVWCRHSGIERRPGLMLSRPKAGNGSGTSPTQCESSSASSSLSESEGSPHRSPHLKRTNEDQEMCVLFSQPSSSSSVSSNSSKKMKKFKRRNEAIYSSTEEDA